MGAFDGGFFWTGFLTGGTGLLMFFSYLVQEFLFSALEAETFPFLTSLLKLFFLLI